MKFRRGAVVIIGTLLLAMGAISIPLIASAQSSDRSPSFISTVVIDTESAVSSLIAWFESLVPQSQTAAVAATQEQPVIVSPPVQEASSTTPMTPSTPAVTPASPAVPATPSTGAASVNVFGLQSAVVRLTDGIRGLTAYLAAQSPSSKIEGQIAALQSTLSQNQSNPNYNASAYFPLGDGTGIAAASNIGQLSNVTISNASISANSIPDLSGSYLSVNGGTISGSLGIGTSTPGSIFSIDNIANFTTATSTFYSSGGINISNGCYAVNGICISGGGGGSGTVGTGVQGQFAFYNAAGTTLSATSSIFLSQSDNVGIGTTTPGSIFSINGVANWTTSTSTLYSTGGINLAGGCFSINGTCVSNTPGIATVAVVVASSTIATFATVGTAPYGVAFDTSGNLYTANYGSGTVSKVTPTGSVSTFATVGSAPVALAFDTSGNLYVANYGSGTVSKVTPGGSVSTFATVGSEPNALAFDSSGNLYVANQGGTTVSKITPGGTVSSFATVGSGPAALAFDTSGNLYTANFGSGTVSEVTPGGSVSTFATVGTHPYALAFDTSGNLYVANYGSGTVSKVTPGGSVSTFATVGSDPAALAFDSSGNLYVANYGNNTVSEVTPYGSVSTFATVGSGPYALAFDTSGNLYAANYGSGTVSKIIPTSTAASTVLTNATTISNTLNVLGNLSASGNTTLSNFVGIGGANYSGNSLDLIAPVGSASNGIVLKNGNSGGEDWRFASESTGSSHGHAGGLIVFNFNMFSGGNSNGGVIMAFDPTGRVGIGTGTTSVSATLSVQGILGDTAPIFDVASSTSPYATTSYFRITATGNVGVSTSSPYSRLEVWGADTASTSAFAVVNSASTTEFSVLDNGNATLSGNLIQNSDQRLKTNISDLDGSSSLAAIDALNPVTFNWIDPAKSSVPQYGFIAQQVQTVFPNLVSTTSPTSLTPNGTLSLNYIDLISPIVAAIQELGREVTALESTVAGFAQSFSSHLIHGDTVTADELCVGSTCIDQEQLAALLASQGQNAHANSSSNTSDGATDTPPAISINGDNLAIIQVGASYNDLGATITGPQADLNLGIQTYVNGILTNPVQIDTSQAATNTIDYVVTDSQGLTSTSTRTIVIEAVANSNGGAGDASSSDATSTGQ